MANPFLGEIKLFAGNFPPQGWALCNGQLLSIAQNTALFSLLGVNFGGDGKTTFGLPNLQGAGPMAFGTPPGLTPRTIGETGGAATVTLSPHQSPAHNHSANCAVTAGNSTSPVGNVWAQNMVNNNPVPGYSNVFTHSVLMADKRTGVTGDAGGGQHHNNLAPYLVLTFIIATVGIYPSRS